MSSKLNQWWRQWLITADEAMTRAHSAWRSPSSHRDSTLPLRLSGLEPRILFSATPVDPAMLPAADEAAVVVEIEAESPISQATEIASLAEQASTDQSPGEVIIIDSAVPDIEQLLDDLGDSGRDAEVFVLDKDRDGIDQLSKILESRSDIDSLHIVSHAEAGKVKLGNLWLGQSNLDGYAGQIAQWQNSLAVDADILFYGCELSLSAEGRTLVNSISELTGADVAASDDATGHAEYRGNWSLEYTTGAIESPVAFSDQLRETWRHKLATITVTTFDDVIDGGDGLTSLREAVIQANAGGGGDTIDLSTIGAGTFLLDEIGAGEDASLTGDLDITNRMTIIGAGAGATIIDGGGIDRVFHVAGGLGSLTMSDVTVQGGNIGGGEDGGGILVSDIDGQLTLDRAVVANNVASDGAGIHNLGTMTLTDVWIVGNGDAMLTAEGGGVHNESVATLNRVTLSGNAAVDGGGIHNDFGATSLSLINVTLSGNTATGVGGGLHNQSTTDITNTTIVLNSAGSGGGISNSGGSVDLLNTIVAANSAGTNPDVEGSFNSLGHNLVGDGTGSTGLDDGVNNDQVGSDTSPIDPMIDPVLADNGGFVPTHALMTGSPAMNNGTASDAPAVDGRGVSRDPMVDIGAYEAPNLPPSIASTGSAHYIEGEGRKIIDPWITVTDPNDTHLEGATIRITGNHTPTEDWLHFVDQNGITGSFSAATGILSLSGTATVGEYQAALRSVEYENTSVNPKTAARSIEFQVFDGEAVASTSNTLGLSGVGPITVDTTSDVSDGNVTSIAALMNDKGTDGKVSLREAIVAANNTLGRDTIHFQIDQPLVGGAHTIDVGPTGLPDIIDSVIIDGTTDDNFAGTPIIELNGAAYLGDGLTLTTGSDNSIIRGLVINRFGDDGIDVFSSDGNIIVGNFIGTDVTGTVNLGNGNDGIHIDASDFNTIGTGIDGAGNLISGNVDDGIAVENSIATVIQGNLIGVDITGTTQLANNDQGILIHNGATGTLIGGNTSGQGNVVSGNLGAGIRIRDVTTTDTNIFGNYIGTDRTASVVVGNTGDGIAIVAGASAVTIGGSGLDRENIISGNAGHGISITNGSEVTIQGNAIGTGRTGTEDLHNDQSGIYHGSSAAVSNVQIGGVQPGEGNTIAFNLMRGVHTQGNGSGDRIEGNLIHDQGLSGILSHRGGGMVIAKNVIHDNSQLTNFDELVVGDGTEVYHNTIHGAADDGISVEGAGVTLHNNIITGSAGFGVRLTASGSILSESNNLITDAMTGPANQGGQANFALDASDVSADPLYLDLASDNFSLTASSPAINRGLDLGGGQVDMNGAAPGLFNATAPEMGAYEHGNAAATVVQPIPDQIIGQDTPLVIQVDETTFSDVEGDVLTYTATLSSGAALPGWLSFDASTGTFSGTPSFFDVGTISIRVQADDGNNNTTFDDFLLTVTPDAAPSDLIGTLTNLGGLSINEDGGNNAYLIADDGSAILGGMTSLSLEVQFNSTTMPPVFGNATFVSYANGVNADGDDLRFGIQRAGVADLRVELGINGNYVTASGFDASQLFDGRTHRVSATWDNTSGDYRFYVDGVQVHSGSGLATGHTIAGGGALTVGTDQDAIGSGFEAHQMFQGSLHDVRIFRDVRTPGEVASYDDRTLRYDTSDMVASWYFNDRSTEGVVLDAVAGNNLTLQEVAPGAGFSVSSPDLTHAVLETASNNTFIGRVTGIDAERESAIADLLAANGNLRYSAETGKFYELISAPTTWADALTSALNQQLQGVDGRLVTIHSAAEQEIVHDLASTGGQSIWLGASDRNLEGQWQWQDGFQDDSQFWSGDASGSIVGNRYQNWDPLQPDGSGDFASMQIGGVNDGSWNDAIESLPHAYVVEWNADEVLFASDPLVYTMIDDAGGRFSIHTGLGLIRVANAALIDYETDTFHDVTVRVTDIHGQDRDATFRIDVREVNEQPSDITLDNTNIDENDAGALIGNLGVVDQDFGDSHTWSVDDSRFEIIGTQLKLKAGQSLDKEAEPTVDLVITAVDQGGTGLSYSETFTITVDNVNEVATDITLSNSSVSENLDGGVVGNITAVDPDAGDTHTWNVDDARFEVAGGQLKLKSGQSLDRETEPSINLMIDATDAGGLRFTKTMTITVDNVNEAPVTDSESYSTTAGDPLLTVAPGVLEGDSDPEGDPFTAVLLSGTTFGTLTLHPDGSFLYTPNPGYVGFDSFTYEAWDGSASSAPTVVTINVTPGFIPADPTPPPADPGSGDPPIEEPPGEEPSGQEGEGGAPGPPPGGPGPKTPRPQPPAAEPNVMLPAVNGEVSETKTTESVLVADVTTAVAPEKSSTEFDSRSRNRESSRSSGRLRIDELIATGGHVEYALMSRPGVMWNELDEKLDYMDSQIHGDLIVVGTAGAAASSFTVGAVAWALRTGFLASGLLAQMPAWRTIDPLLIMQGLGGESDEETLEELMKRQSEELDD